MKRDFCCHGACNQGRDNCPLRKTDRRQRVSLLWLLFGWLMKDRRDGKDRRK
jgi:hypothetical protein